jgi:TP53 regulating kinase-like protein
MTQKIAQGAEAIIYSDRNIVIKHRFEKKYRHPSLDQKLRKTRTRREYKILEKLHSIGFPVPVGLEMDDNNMKLSMSKILGETLKTVVDVLEKKGDKKQCLELFRTVGEQVAVLHNNGIVHHDLTTSNMILNSEDKNIYFIDFGLSFFSDKIEDYAVDLHLLKRALESRHHRIFEECFEAILTGYKKKSSNSKEILKRLELVELRGRNKAKH